MGRRRVLGQTSTEVMLVISVVTVATTAAAYNFVPRFEQGVRRLGGDARHVLGTGSFAGLGRANATVHDAPTGGGQDEGGTEEGNNGQAQQAEANLARQAAFMQRMARIYQMMQSVPGMQAFYMQMYMQMQAMARQMNAMATTISAAIQESLLAKQNQEGGAPPTGIDGQVCGLWAISYIANILGIDGADLQTLMTLARSSAGVLGNASDFRIDAVGMGMLGAQLGLSQRNTAGQNFPQSKTWLESELAAGRQPTILVSRNGQPHWMVVTGTIIEPDTGRVIGYTFQDSTTNVQQAMNLQELQVAWALHGNEGISFGEGSPSGAVATSSP